MYELLGVTRLELLTRVGQAEYHACYAHLGAARRFIRYWLGR